MAGSACVILKILFIYHVIQLSGCGVLETWGPVGYFYRQMLINSKHKKLNFLLYKSCVSQNLED